MESKAGILKAQLLETLRDTESATLQEVTRAAYQYARDLHLDAATAHTVAEDVAREAQNVWL